MAVEFDAAYRVFIHTPPSESAAGSPAIRYQRGPQRAGVMEWRTNDFEAACRKARRIIQGHDSDNHVRPGGWVSVQQNQDGRYRSVEIFTTDNT